MAQIISIPYCSARERHVEGLGRTGKTFRIENSEVDFSKNAIANRVSRPEFLIIDYSFLDHIHRLTKPGNALQFLREIPIIVVCGGDRRSSNTLFGFEKGQFKNLNVIYFFSIDEQLEPANFCALAMAFDEAVKTGSITADSFKAAITTGLPRQTALDNRGAPTAVACCEKR